MAKPAGPEDNGAVPKTLFSALCLAAWSATAAGQTPSPPVRRPLATAVGHEIAISGQHYRYEEPDPTVDISIAGLKVGGEYTGTWVLSQRRHWFLQLNARVTGGPADYDGWCRPWQIEPSATSANGYALRLGTRFTCDEQNDSDWYADGRLIIGKDLIGNAWSVSPFTGIGARHLANGITGHANFRTDAYVYVPVGMTLRTTLSSTRALGLTVEYDHLIRGWQTTRNSLLGSGTVPATSTAPAFTIGDFTDLSFDQHHGRALRASATVPVTDRWSIQPYYTHWRIEDSPISTGSVAYAVGGVTVRGQLNAYEPFNTTAEFGVKIGFRFGGR